MGFEPSAELRVKILSDDRVLIQHGSTDDATDLEEMRLERIKDAVEESLEGLSVDGGGIIEDDEILEHEVCFDSTTSYV